MYTELGWLSCKNCNPSVSAGSDIKESRGKWKQRRGREEERGSKGVEKWSRRRQRETWRVDSGILSWCTVTYSGFYPQGIQFPPSSLPQILPAMSGSHWRETRGKTADKQDFECIFIIIILWAVKFQLVNCMCTEGITSALWSRSTGPLTIPQI